MKAAFEALKAVGVDDATIKKTLKMYVNEGGLANEDSVADSKANAEERPTEVSSRMLCADFAS